MNMEITVRLVEGEIGGWNAAFRAGAPESCVPESGVCETGAVVTFDGRVRGSEVGRILLALDYEAYEPMASRELEKLARGLAAKHTAGKARIQAVRVWHSVGRVPVGGCSFRLEVASVHRKEALAFMDEFIDEMKKQVPLWKNPQFA